MSREKLNPDRVREGHEFQRLRKKLNFDRVREGHEFIRAAKSLKMDARFSA